MIYINNKWKDWTLVRNESLLKQSASWESMCRQSDGSRELWDMFAIRYDRVWTILKWIYNVIITNHQTHSCAHGHTTQACRTRRQPESCTNMHNPHTHGCAHPRVHAHIQEFSAKPHIHTHTGALVRHKPHSHTLTRTLLQCIPPYYWSRPRHRMPVHLTPWATGRRSRRRNRWVPAVWIRAPGTQLLYCTTHTYTHTHLHCMHEYLTSFKLFNCSSAYTVSSTYTETLQVRYCYCSLTTPRPSLPLHQTLSS